VAVYSLYVDAVSSSPCLASSECMSVTNEFVQRNWGKRGQVRPDEPVWRSGFELGSTWEQNTRVTAWPSLFHNSLWIYVMNVAKRSYVINVAKPVLRISGFHVRSNKSCVQFGIVCSFVGLPAIVGEVFLTIKASLELRHTTVGRTPLDEWSTHCRDLYITHNTHSRKTSIPPTKFEPTIPAWDRPQTPSVDRAPTGTGY
jgi:hypothetical protein